MTLKQDDFVLVTFLADDSEHNPELVTWLKMQSDFGFDRIVIYQPLRAYNRRTFVNVLEDPDRLQRKPLLIDAGDPLKSSILSAMMDDTLIGSTYAIALNPVEYLDLGSQVENLAGAISALTKEFSALVLPLQRTHGKADQSTNSVVNVGLRTLFRIGTFSAHNGVRPLSCGIETYPIWVDQSGQRVDPDELFWNVPASEPCSSLTPKKRSELLQVKAEVPEAASIKAPASENKKSNPAPVRSEPLHQSAAPLAPSEEGDDLDLPLADADTSSDMPPWFEEIGPMGGCPGFYRRLKHNSLVFVQRPSDTLVVTFDNLSAVNDESPHRVPWGYKFLRQDGHAHLGVLAHRKDWYREPELISAMQSLKDQGFFKNFGNVVFSGTSMGGFAALVFSSLSPGARVLAFSPQSTLDEGIVPWETRFGMGRMRNWKLPFSDAAFEIEDAAQVVVISDPFFKLDQMHVDRLNSPNVIQLKAWYSGHFSPVFLRRAELLKPIMGKMISNTLTEKVFYRLYRDRRKLPWYKRSLEETLTQRGRDTLASRVGPAFHKAKAEDNRARQTATGK